MPEIDKDAMESAEARLSDLLDKITGLRRELSITFQLAESMVLDLHKVAGEGIEQRMAISHVQDSAVHWRDRVLKAWQALAEMKRS